MFRKHIFLTMVLAITLCTMSAALAEVNPVTPSTNDLNKGYVPMWAHVNVMGVGPGTTTLQFVSMRDFYSCFEYRTDGDTSQVLTENGGVNYNSEITDGLYPYFCVNNSERTVKIYADEFVEVRLVFGEKKEERFDWTRFEVLPDVPPEGPPPAFTKDDCKNGGWASLTRPDGSPFKNQGDCIQYVNTGK